MPMGAYRLMVTFFLGLTVALLTYIIPRQAFSQLLGFYGIAFVFYLVRITWFKGGERTLFYEGLLIRLGLIVAVPNLSDDFYRFLWDGQMNLMGISPFSYTPEVLADNLLSISDQASTNYLLTLLDGMNSKEYYTIYPPVHQAVFTMASLAAPHIIVSVIVIRLALLAAEIGTYFSLQALLGRFKICKSRLAWYWLNPLMIIEFIGNLHFEGVMICFLLWSIFCLTRSQLNLAALFYATAVCTKLWPLMFLPLLYRHLGFKKLLQFSFTIAILSVLAFWPFMGEGFFVNFGTSIELYFRRFEFNASVFYIIRFLGFKTVGYDVVQTAGPILAAAFFSFIIFYSFLRPALKLKHALQTISLVFLVFLFLSTTIHPWYVTLLAGLAPVTGFRHGLAWSGTVFLSYFAYGQVDFDENALLIILEYVVVLTVLLVDIRHRNCRLRDISKPL